MSLMTVEKVSYMSPGGAWKGGAVSLLTAAVLTTGCSTFPSAGTRALTELKSLQQRPVTGEARREYWQIEEAVARAQLHLKRGERERAEALFDQASGKARELSERLDSEKTRKDISVPSNPPAEQERGDGPEKVNLPGAVSSTPDLKHHAPEKPLDLPQSESQPALPTPSPVHPVEPSVVDRAVIEQGGESKESAEEPPIAQPRFPGIIGKKLLYTVGKHESLRYIGAKFGVSWRQIAEQNRIDPKAPLREGQVLRIDTRRIVPRQIDNGIVINIPDRTLYYFRNGEVDRMFAVAVGKPKTLNNSDKRDWHTPTGSFRIVGKVKDPTWRVPLSIQKEMAEQGREVKTVVPPGASNPLGKFALKTSIPGILIHSTNRPESVYGFSSHGCIRVFPEFMEELFNAVSQDTTGEIVYEPVKITALEGGRVYLEVHRDIYNRYANLDEQVKGIAQEYRVEELIDWNKVRRVLKRMKGVPEDISL